MATVLVLAHEHDRFHSRGFMVQGLFPHLIEAGHFAVVHEGLGELPAADIAFLHVDRTVVPEEYRDELGRYARVVNGATVDIGKRTFSENLVSEVDGWDGPVIIKTNANCAGLPELYHAQCNARLGADRRTKRPPCSSARATCATSTR
jgi:hypothetical protein